MKIKVTAKQRANAIEARDVMWASVPEENVAFDLGFWHLPPQQVFNCNTVACFGGWCAAWPSFVAQGVTADTFGAPVLHGGSVWGVSVAHFLFGDCELFDERTLDDGPDTDHEVVTRRLNNLIANSELIE